MPEFDFEAGYRRLDAAMNGGSAEIPFVVQMHEFAMAHMRQPGQVFYTDPKVFTRGICQTAMDYHFDTPSFIWDVYNVEAEALGLPLVLFEDMAPALENLAPLIENEADLARLKAPDPSSAGRMPMVAEILHQAKELTGRRPPLCFCAPFTLAAHLMTFENLVVRMRHNPAFVHKVMDFIVDEVLAPYGRYMLKQFPDLPLLDGSDAIASLPFITLEMQEEFAMEPILRLRRQLTLPVLVDNWWGDSYTQDKQRFWRNKLKVTPDYFKIQDPDLWKTGLAEPMDFARRLDKPVVLGIDNNLFQSGPAEEIEKRVHEYMEAVEETDGKGCVYFCNLSAVTPPGHVGIAVDAVLAFRRGERPWKGLRRAGTPEARGETGEATAQDDAAALAAGQESPEKDQFLDRIFEAVLEKEDRLTSELISQGLEKGIPVQSLLDDALIAAMDEVGDEFSRGVIYVPEMLMAARAMKAGLEVLRPVLARTGEQPKGLVILATVQGDVHDIGKNLVGMMLEGAGYQVVDLGVNVKPEEILERAGELKPDVVCLSALLTTSMPSMQKTVALFKQAESVYPMIVGGAPVTEEFALEIGADGYGEDAPHAVEAVQRLIAGGPGAQSAA